MESQNMLFAILNCKEVDRVFIHNNAGDGKPELNIQFKDFIDEIEFENCEIEITNSCAIWEQCVGVNIRR